mmetsp:Transcript_32981/g.84882  ORF Transcript_32981/g.84882 Transcript_32981/m.84882 type:complete len:206 (-) Transcript_32981:76-693(-)
MHLMSAHASQRREGGSQRRGPGGRQRQPRCRAASPRRGLWLPLRRARQAQVPPGNAHLGCELARTMRLRHRHWWRRLAKAGSGASVGVLPARHHLCIAGLLSVFVPDEVAGRGTRLQAVHETLVVFENGTASHLPIRRLGARRVGRRRRPGQGQRLLRARGRGRGACPALGQQCFVVVGHRCMAPEPRENRHCSLGRPSRRRWAI